MILADENLPESICSALEVAGFTVERVRTMSPGIDDHTVLATAVSRDLVVVTQDKDFGDLVHRDALEHRGVVLVRLRGLPFAERAARVVAVFEEHGEALRGAFTVIANKGVRVRGGT